MDCTSSSTVHSSSPPSDQDKVGKRDADKDIIDEGSKDGSQCEGSKFTDGNEHRTVKEEGNDDRTGNGGKVTSMDASVAIIGAGIAGLSAAHQLKLYGFTKVTVLEASNRTGGRIYTHTINGKYLILLSLAHLIPISITRGTS